ncbi:MAG: ATP-dependent zinc metalloprotease FtsH [Atopobiaceae bacterium]|jgi:cell division protease FtsH|nr:ATP-dependent zinc metalloprotease FtsH [Atopobiaceae bacterium]MCH4120484.1 ATP-dependent zinc metalloprotease FtsH [Atopobiaceae bacterium]MCI1318150.1 ATP-dependent zinc metalloprotease FtsH [Atopobiaceae bacterium]MCI1388322.1 ATP-dependent zinc metalloprotease FtsH [Atopobiaceae bacterium]MCI1431428.1 ATP-dependent zinc metalloprotease FtsH [Atopobiaceae bacterium]
MDPNSNQKRRQTMFIYAIVALFVVYILSAMLSPQIRQSVTKEVSYSDFLEQVDDGDVQSVTLNTDSQAITYHLKGDDTLYTTTQFPDDTTLVSRLEEKGVDFSADASNNSDSTLWWVLFLSYAIPIVIMLLGGWALNRYIKKSMGDDGPSMTFGSNMGMGMGGLGKSGAREVKGEDTGVTFKDVAGQDEAKESLAEIVGFLEDPSKYAEIGAKLPRGALLVGPPGTGKTLLAKAVAGEARVPFFSISGSEFVEMFVGRGAAKVRDLFKQANEKAPCIVFIDEIDTIGKRRDAGLTTNDEREQTLNQLLTEMDGFDNHKGIVVLAATNRPDTLDPALLRPGRFDRRIPVELPDLAGRKAILELHRKDVKTQGPIDLDVIARSTPGASGADLANIINEAALRAVRMGRRAVIQEDIEESVEVVIAGEKRKSTVLSEHEKQVVSYHEIGHAIVAASQKGAAPVSKITIVPRTSGALGYTMQVEEDEHFLTTRKEAKDRIAVLCGGRAAEELIFGEMTTGAANDIEKATELARNMVTQYGMSDEFGMVALGQVQNRYLNSGSTLTCSEGTAEKVDEEVMRLVEEGHKQALATLQAHKFKLHELARYLQKKETITGEEFMNIFTRDDGFAPNLAASSSDNSSTR